MLNFRVAWRLLLRHPFGSAVELLGLAAGFAICFLLVGFVRYSFSYDSDVPQREQVYVIKHRLNFIPQPRWMEYTPFPLREVALQSGLPLQASVWWPSKAMLNQDGAQREIDITAVDPAFEQIAGLHALRGDLHQALTLPDGLALTQRAAAQLFGAGEALGRMVYSTGKRCKCARYCRTGQRTAPCSSARWSASAARCGPSSSVAKCCPTG